MSLNLFRIVADLSHFMSILILLHKMPRQFADLLSSPPADLFWTHSPYNFIFKVLFIGCQSYIIYLMTSSYRPTNDPNLDTFRVQYLLLVISLILAILFPHFYSFFEVMWTFSIWLESVAILPQLFMLQRTGEAETITTHYLFALGIYRAL
ncbi:ER lumen protein retaining receptor [Ceratocystis lukuohia]|uniref:ER lumen protein-retaining receptor n=1 Tax=Ceratocystis lukuohia TaxID=2019550 RepID=A0ABR4MF40_9PEZI